jgi:ribosomal protein L11 methylase PrmA
MVELFGPVLLAFSIIFFLIFSLSYILGFPYAPSTNRAIQSMMTLSHAGPRDTVYDLGSGDGRIVIEAAKLGAHAIGIEINPLLALLSSIRIRFSPQKKHANVVWGDFWHFDLMSATIVMAYLPPQAMEKLRKKLTAECKPDTIVVTNSHIYTDWKEIGRDAARHTYAYRIP